MHVSALIEKSRSQSLFLSAHHTLMRPHSYPRMLVAAVPLFHVHFVETPTCETRHKPQMKSTHEQYQIISRTHFPSASAHTIRPPMHTRTYQLLSPKSASPPHIIPAPTHNHCCSSIHRAHPALHRTNIIPHTHAHPHTYISCRPQINNSNFNTYFW